MQCAHSANVIWLPMNLFGMSATCQSGCQKNIYTHTQAHTVQNLTKRFGSIHILGCRNEGDEKTRAEQYRIELNGMEENRTEAELN